MNEVIPAGESTAVAVRSASPFDGNVVEFKQALARRGENRGALMEWIRKALVDGQDFGRIHTTKKRDCRHGDACTPEIEPRHWSKPSLRKPGAEKICGMLGVTPTFPTIKEYEQAALNGIEISSIVLRCHLMAADGVQVLADGIGARNLAQDYGDLNKALKMACKSAHIDATLRMAGLSEIFTQDLEDMKAAEEERERQASGHVDGGHEPQHEPHNQAPPRRSAPKQQTQAPRSTGGRGFATEKQVFLIERRLGDAGIDTRDLCEAFKVDSLQAIPFGKVNEVLDWIAEGGAAEPAAGGSRW
jgi:hypothetical protein